MTAKDLIELLQTMNPELPIQIRMEGRKPQKKGEPNSRSSKQRTRNLSSLQYSLQPTDVVDTWNGDIGAVAIELSVRI